jgi:solute:Na+ symporter, SSS family
LPRFALLDWIAIGGYLIFALAVGILLTRRASRGTGEFYLAGRTLPWWIAGTSLVATSFAADTPLVVAGWVRSDGIAKNWLWWGMAVGGSLVIVVLAAWWRRLEVTTDAEIIEHRYHGRPARILRGFYGGYHALITNTMVLTWVLVAMKKLVRVILDLGDQNYDGWIVAGALLLALSYSFMSGFWGVVITDLFQFALALLGAVVLAWKAVDELGGLGPAQAAFAALPQHLTTMFPKDVNPETGISTGWEALSWWMKGFGSFVIFVGVQGWLNKNADGGGIGVQRYSACKTENHARGAALWFHIAHYCLRPWPWILVGLASLILIDPSALPLLENADGTFRPDHEAAYPMMMAMLLGPGLFGLLCASFLAAFMSTLDTHFNMASAYLVNDVYRRFMRPNQGDRHYVWVGRCAEIGVALLAGLMATAADSISDLFVLSLSLLGGLGPAMLLRWFWWRANTWTEVSALASSTVMTLLLNTTQLGAAHNLLDIPYPLSYPLVVGTSLVICLITTLLTAPVDRDHLCAFFAKVRPVGLWGPIGRSAPGQKRAIFLGWAGALALIYGLMLGIGEFLMGTPFMLSFCCAGVGALVLRWTWPRTAV